MDISIELIISTLVKGDKTLEVYKDRNAIRKAH